MTGRGGTRLIGGLIALGVAAAAYLASPPAPRAQSAQDPKCNIQNTGKICKIQEDCVWFIFYKKCTTEYWRQPLQGDFPAGGGDDDEDERGKPKIT